MRFCFPCRTCLKSQRITAAPPLTCSVATLGHKTQLRTSLVLWQVTLTQPISVENTVPSSNWQTGLLEHTVSQLFPTPIPLSFPFHKAWNRFLARSPPRSSQRARRELPCDACWAKGPPKWEILPRDRNRAAVRWPTVSNAPCLC